MPDIGSRHLIFEPEARSLAPPLRTRRSPRRAPSQRKATMRTQRAGGTLDAAGIRSCASHAPRIQRGVRVVRKRRSISVSLRQSTRPAVRLLPRLLPPDDNGGVRALGTRDRCRCVDLARPGNVRRLCHSRHEDGNSDRTGFASRGRSAILGQPTPPPIATNAAQSTVIILPATRPSPSERRRRSAECADSRKRVPSAAPCSRRSPSRGLPHRRASGRKDPAR